MAAGQGMKRIARGIERPFTRFEFQRGYVYLTRDRRLVELLDTNRFDLDFCGQKVADRRIDKFGRFLVPRDLIRAVSPDAVVSISIADRSTVRVRVIR